MVPKLPSPKLTPAKFVRPHCANLIKRERLFQQLDKSLEGRLTWIVAPAGSGKTSLISSYFNNRKKNCAWYSLDAYERDPYVFFQSIGQAFTPFLNNQELPLYNPTLTPNPIEFTALFFNRLYAQLNEPICLVLDDFHRLGETHEVEKVHHIIATAVEHLPSACHIVVASRHLPPAALSRFTSAPDASLLFHDTLKFQPNEVDDLLKLMEIDQFSQTQQLALLSASDGWAAGVTLLLRDYQLKGVLQFSDANEANKQPTLSVDNQSILYNYFSGVMLNELSEKQQNTLVFLACLPYITEELSNAVCQNETGWDLIKKLYESNTFVAKRHDLPEEQFEFHHLFQAFLTEKSAQLYSEEELKSIHIRIANTLLAARLVDEAVALYAKAESWKNVISVLYEHGIVRCRFGQVENVYTWVQLVPTHLRDEDPWLLFLSGLSQSIINPQEPPSDLKRACEMFLESDDLQALAISWSTYINTLVLQWREDELYIEKIIARFSDDLSQYDKDTVIALLEGMTSIAPTYPNYDQILDRYLSPAMDYFFNTEDPNRVTLLGFNLTMIFQAKGGQYSELRKLNSHTRAQFLTGKLSSFSRAILSLRLYQQGFFDYDMTLFEESINEQNTLIQNEGVAILDMYADAGQAYLLLYKNQAPLADKLIEEYEKKWHMANPVSRSQYFFMSSWSAIQQDQMQKALVMAENGIECINEFLQPIRAMLALMASYAACNLNQQTKLQEHIQTIEANIPNKNHEGPFQIEYHYLQAHIALAQHDYDRAEQALSIALQMASRQRVITACFLFHSIRQKLLAFALERQIEPEYAIEQIQKIGLAPPPYHHSETWPWKIKILTQQTLKIFIDGEPLIFGRKTPRKLLEVIKAMVVLGGRDVPLHRIADLLWPESPGDDAQGALDTTLHRLRKILGKDTVVVYDGKISFNSDLCWVDTWALETAMRNLDEQNKTGHIETESATRMHRWAKELQRLYRHRILEKDEESPWLITYREKMHQRIGKTLATTVQQLSRGGHPALAESLLSAQS